jgi:Uma2 family endonuclease
MTALYSDNLSECNLENVYFSIDDYLAFELGQDERHEYVQGQVRSMAGASSEHEEVALNIAVLLKIHLRGKRCRPYKGDMKLRVDYLEEGVEPLFYYPDVMVVGDEQDGHPLYKTKPRLIVEVMSRNVGRDLLEKLQAYQQIPTLEEYFVISQNRKEPLVFIHRRRTGFKPELLKDGAFTFESVELTTSVAEVYEL